MDMQIIPQFARQPQLDPIKKEGDFKKLMDMHTKPKMVLTHLAFLERRAKNLDSL
jgi:hypothetical protein